MSLNAKPFEFVNEFTRSGDVLSGEKPKFKRIEDVEREVAQALAQGEAAAMQSIEASIAASLEKIVASLTPAQQVVAQTAQSLRNDAIDLAMAAARRIANEALDEFGDDLASNAVASAAQQLRDVPEILVIASPDVAQGAAMRLENMPGLKAQIRFHPDPQARPGDWRIEFAQGAVSHSREAVEAAVEQALEQRKQEPVESQLDLFGGAQVA